MEPRLIKRKVKKIGILEVLFSTQYITSFIGLTFWLIVIHFTDDFTAGVLIGLISSLFSFFYTKERMELKQKMRER